MSQAVGTVRRMFHAHTAADAPSLARGLVEVLRVPLADPFEPEWIAVPSSGMRRWLALELARSLGTSVGANDGVTANIVWAFPGSLRRAVLDAGVPAGSVEPWEISRLVWTVLTVFDELQGDTRFAALLDPAHRAPRYTRARNVADLFDRYHVHRPEMVLRWAAGADVDGQGRPLAAEAQWQPQLWRAVRERVGVASPPERMPELLAAVRDGSLDLALPSRLVVFGTTVAPGGASFYELAAAISTRHELHSFQFELSPGLAERARAVTRAGSLSLTAARSAVPIPGDGFELLSAWGRQPFEGAVLAAAAELAGSAPAPSPAVTTAEARSSLLARLQASIHADRPPERAPLDPHDTSVRVHACHGANRQVEVARDAILHLLAADPTLREDDIVVMCPALDRFAPIVESVFGPSSDLGLPDRGAPALRYRVADRSVRAANPVLAAVSNLLALVAGRFEASTVLDFCALPVVRARLGFDDSELERMRSWASDLGIRWGLDAVHRERFGVPRSVRTNTWQWAIDRLLLGSAVLASGTTVLFDRVVPVAAESGDAELAGRLGDLFARLRPLVDVIDSALPLAEWIALLQSVALRTLGTAYGDEWQFDALLGIFADLLDSAEPVDPATTVPLIEIADLQRIVEERFADAPGRPDFFRGGMMVTSLRPLRGIPFRVVVLLDLGDAGFGAASSTGDDLVARNPQIGDRDARADARQSLLEAVLAAQEHLVIVRDARDIRTNAEIPESIVLTELLDAVYAHVDVAEVDAARTLIHVEHPRHGFDTRCFTAPSVMGAMPWSFDPDALAAARAALAPVSPPVLCPEPIPETPSTVVLLDELRACLRDPLRTFVAGRLEMHVAAQQDTISDDLPVEVANLEQYAAGERLLSELVTGAEADAWARAEALRGAVIVESRARAALDDLATEVAAVAAAVQRCGADAPKRLLPIEAHLASDTTVVGVVSVADHAFGVGPVLARFVRPGAANGLALWLDLLVLTVVDPETRWEAVLVQRAPRQSTKSSKSKPSTPQPSLSSMRIVGDDAAARRDAATTALAGVVALYRRARTEPLPIVAATSAALANGDSVDQAWASHERAGDRDDPVVRAAFGRLELHEFLEIPARPDDPAGPAPGRAERWAEHLWGLIGASCVTSVPGAPS